ncbi:MAG TPA: LolA-related protein [Steroidobacteraceae bacterium]|nr:LolA-related protein [Steroidobacteraceae bacterium]
MAGAMLASGVLVMSAGFAAAAMQTAQQEQGAHGGGAAQVAQRAHEDGEAQAARAEHADRKAQAHTGQDAQGEFTLGELMGSLARRKHGEVSYVQEDYFAILDRPVKSSGVLVYVAPDRLEKRTLKPKRESLVLQGDELTVQRGRRTYHLQLSAYPQVAPLVDAVRDTLAGNEEGLERAFEVGLTGTAENWKLKLRPLDKAVARKVRGVEIAGARDEIRSVTISQVDGDRSVMTLGAPRSASGPQTGAPSDGGGAGR